MKAVLDIRYHWLTLVALFLALGLGILIGTGLGERGTLSQEQARLAEQLEASLIRLREENHALRRAGEELARDLEAAQAVAETIARMSVLGRLAGRTVFLVLSDGTGGAVAATGGAHGPQGAEATGEQEPSEVEAIAARWEGLLQRAGATVVRQWTGRQDGFPAADGALALYVNPPPNLPIPDGLRAAVVWDAGYGAGGGDVQGQIPGGPERGEMALPSDWLVVRAGQGALAEWALIEGIRGGWKGYVDASGPAGALYSRLGVLVGDTGGRDEKP